MTRAAALQYGATLALSVALWNATPATASPDGAEWAIVEDPAGCVRCHLGDTDPAGAGLGIDGLPTVPAPDQRYRITIRLVDPALKNAGFLLSVSGDGLPAGTLEPVDARTETEGALARSTWEGSFPRQAGEADWTLVYQTPASLPPALTFDLWANVGNDDLSPLGDQPRHRRVVLDTGTEIRD